MGPGVPISPRSAAAEQRRLQPPKLEDTIFGREGVSDRLLEIIKTQEDGIVKVNLALQEVRGRLEGMFDKVDGVIGEYGVWVSDWQLATTRIELSDLLTKANQLERDNNAYYEAQAPVDPVGVDLELLRQEFGRLRHNLYKLKEQLSMMKDQEAPMKMAAARRNKPGVPFDLVKRSTPWVEIPDIHGDVDAVDMSLKEHGVVDPLGNWIGGDAVVVYSGDFPDRGPHSLGAIKYALDMTREAEKVGGRGVFIAGNHELMLLRALARYKHASGDDLPDKFDHITDPDQRLFAQKLLIINNWVGKQDHGGEFNSSADVIFREILGDDTVSPAMDLIGWGKQIKPDAEMQYLINVMDHLLFHFMDPRGQYHEFVQRLQWVEQIDDVIFTHTGASSPDDAEVLSVVGIDATNEAFKAAVAKAFNSGDFTEFAKFNRIGESRGGIGAVGMSAARFGSTAWADWTAFTAAQDDYAPRAQEAEQEMARWNGKQASAGNDPMPVMTDEDRARVVRAYKLLGANIAVGGHSRSLGGYVGIKQVGEGIHTSTFVNTDVAISRGYTGDPGRGGMRMDVDGSWAALNRDRTFLRQEVTVEQARRRGREESTGWFSWAGRTWNRLQERLAPKI